MDVLDPLARRVDRLTRGAVGRLVASEFFTKAKAGSGHVLAHPTGLAAEAVQVVKLPRLRHARRRSLWPAPPSPASTARCR